MLPSKQLIEKCGIVGLFNRNPHPNLLIALTAAGGVQHRGQQGIGLLIKTGKGYETHKSNGTIKEVFNQNLVKKFDKPAFYTMVHCRYGTFGNYKDSNLQPCVITNKSADIISVIHNGEFAQTSMFKEIIQKEKKTVIEEGISDTYLFSQALSLIPGNNWDQKIVSFLGQCKGSFSLIIGINNSLYIIRDKFGIRPLILGKINSSFLVASETHAFNKVGATIIREIRKGEILKFDSKGIHMLKKETKGNRHFCDFEWAYFSRPESLYPTSNSPKNKSVKNWMSISLFREKTGEVLAQEAPIPNASFVIGIPDSGIALGTGYANKLKIPYRQVIVRDHFDRNGADRLFMRDDQMKKISKKVLGKLSLVSDFRIWKDATVVIADDSIVRGNVSSQITKAIFSLGVKEIHWIIGFPPILFKCHLGVSIRTGEELIALRHKADPKKIAQDLGATSVSYISPEGFIKARLLDQKIKIPKDKREIFLANGGCGGCITGVYPVTSSGVEYTPKV